MPEDRLLEARHLARHYGGREAVSDVNLHVNRGEVLGLLGLNGAGKTTTLRMLCGTLAPSAGEIRLCGIDLLESPIMAKRQLGYLPEIPPLYPDTRVREYLHYAATLRRVPRRDRRVAVDAALEATGLADVAHRLIRNLSKGYQQRVGIAQAVVHSPALVVLDEPTAGLDPQQVQDIRKLIQRLQRDRAVIFSSHILGEVQALCDRVVILHQGRQVYAGAPQGGESRVTRSFSLRFRSSPPLEVMAVVPGVEVTERLSNGYRIEIGLDSALDALVALSVEEGWGLVELTEVRPTLEQVFLEVTTGRVEAA
ncbi:ABC-2 type transport system ATP-binding protein [Natronocella acetinitrilica]|uniref:ABC-2 type transport system ATP-binding protein n=1 Tax=Natronocella acetinitrilica TaxID=414046 RepID=A0AAE3G0I2_9GAMM|nr:ABC transporter ATP-binding protein [Natronocella acetinitrilica]MCP1673155.1 ABC-2 type transport system ATP-binding protein [Natronocella acetinitrilica]